MTTTWRKAITKTMLEIGDIKKGATQREIEFFWNQNVRCTLSEEELDVEFDDGYGGSNGAPFTAWSKRWVYFPLVYDGSEWCGYAPRRPRNIKMPHQGGE